MTVLDHVNDDVEPGGEVGVPSPGRAGNGRYAASIAASKAARWDIDEDVVRGRTFQREHKFLPDGLSFVEEFFFLSPAEKLYVSQIQGRTYANVFGLVERFINAKVLELSRDHWLGDQTALEALVRFSDEELKHQALFRRIDRLAASALPAGYRFTADPDAVAGAVLGKSTWAVLGLTLHIELFTQSHYRESIAPDGDLSPLFKDVFHHHWQEERQHAVIDELEWRRIDAGLSDADRDAAVDDLIALIGAVDGVIGAQARADAGFFFDTGHRVFGRALKEAITRALVRAYRWQFILSGARHPHFVKVLTSLTTEAQQKRIQDALAALE